MTRTTTARAAAALEAAAALANPQTVILDTETTDLSGYLVQIAIIDTSGAMLLDTLVNPLAPISSGAQAVHGLTLEQLADEKTFADVEPGLRELLRDRDVWIYNVGFDRSILEREIVRLEEARGAEGSADGRAYSRALEWTQQCRWHCVMEVYAQWVGDWSRYHGGYKYQRLPGGDHSALGDCLAALAVLRRMAEEA